MEQSLARRLTSGNPHKLVAFGLGGGVVAGGTGMLLNLSIGLSALLGVQVALLIFLGLMSVRLDRNLNRARNAATKASERAAYAQAMPMLYDEIDVPRPLPTLDGWTLEPDGFLLMAQLIEENRPRVIVEFGSGASTTTLAYLAEKTGGNFLSIEEDAEWANRTRRRLQSWGIEGAAVHHVPVLPEDQNQGYTWYSIEGVQEVLGRLDIDLVLVDGPTAQHGRRVRDATLPVIADWLSDEAIVVFDDYGREGESEFLAEYQERFPESSTDVISRHKEMAVFRPNGEL